MARYFIYLSYDGSNYHGWQIQPNARTVQQELEGALALLLRENCPVVGAGRTDTGVNAAQMVAHANLPENIDTAQLIYKLNKVLPPDISVSAIRRVKDDAHARFDAVSRCYCYYVSTVKSPFARRYACRVPSDLNFEAMNNAARVLPEYTDFTSFSKLHTDVKTNNCKIKSAQWKRLDDNHWVFEIEADRFLRNMVRAIVGTLVDVGRGRYSVEEFEDIILSKDLSRSSAGAPACGLFLSGVKY